MNFRPFQVRGSGLPIVAGGLFGLAVFAVTLGFTLANPQRIDWLLRGDWSHHFLGWHLYRHTSWTLPLGASPLVRWPMGTSVGLTDSIPIFAFAFKLVEPILPADFQYIGLWLLLCFVLQGVFGALLMRTATTRAVPQILGAALFVLSPAMVQRIGHPALTAQWLLLASLWLYFRHGMTWSGGASAAWIAVASIAALTHPYLTVMVLALMGAAAIRQVFVHPSEFLRTCAIMMTAVGSAGLMLWQSGYFMVSATDDLQAGGFGAASMNLLAPIMSTEGSRIFGRGPFDYATSSQYEGYAYLGAGVLLLALVAVVRLPALAIRTTWTRQHLQHLPLLVVCLVLTLHALSPTITASAQTLVQYSQDWWGPLSVFRASGRVFWPVYYVLVFGIMALTARLPDRLGVTLLAVALGVQVFDLSGAKPYEAMRQVREVGYKNQLESAFWSVVPAHYKHLTIMPTNVCGLPEAAIDYTPYALVAGRHGLSLNAGGVARFDLQRTLDYCRTLELEMQQGLVQSDTLYVLHPSIAAVFQAAAQSPVICTTLDGFSVCLARDSYAAWQRHFDLMSTFFPSGAELAAFHEQLDEEYRDRLRRPARSVSASPTERFTVLARYVWYRVSACDADTASRQALEEARGSNQLRLCGNPSRQRPLPPVNETFAFWKDASAVYAERPAQSSWTTHVDQEGEAVWMHAFIAARLQGRDAYGAGVDVLNAIRSLD